MQEDGYDKGAHQSYLETERNTLSFQTGFNLVNAAVACAILESISGVEPSSVIPEPRYLKLVTPHVPNDETVSKTGRVGEIPKPTNNQTARGV